MAHNRVVHLFTSSRKRRPQERIGDHCSNGLQWWLFDAKHQCPFRSAEKLSMYLEGRHTKSDLGDHVVVINTKDVSMPDDLWRTFSYFHHTRYAGGFSRTSAWRLHEMDPTRVMEKAVYRAMPKNLMRRTMMQRLHLFAESEVPDELMDNVSDVVRQIQVMPKKLEDYSEAEIAAFPKLFDWPTEHVLFDKGPPPESEATEES